jgi:hypothetical protein
MPEEVTIRIHSIKDDGMPDMEALTGRVAFIFDGCVVSGWPLRTVPTRDNSAYTGAWEADSDVGRNVQFEDVTHWIEFPAPVWNYEKRSK